MAEQGDICQVQGVPRWITYLLHRWSARRCAKTGHVRKQGYVCDHCGLYLARPNHG